MFIPLYFFTKKEPAPDGDDEGQIRQLLVNDPFWAGKITPHPISPRVNTGGDWEWQWSSLLPPLLAAVFYWTHGIKNVPLAHRICLICLPTVMLLKLDVGPEPVGAVNTYSTMVGTSYVTRYSLIQSAKPCKKASQKVKRFQLLWRSLDRKSTVKSATVWLPFKILKRL